MNKALKTLYLYNGIFTFAGGLFGPLYAVYIAQIGLGITVISTSWALFLISSTLATFILSKFGDSIKEKENLLMIGFLLRAIVWVLYIFVGNVLMLIILQILLGIGEAFGSPAYNVLVAEHLDRGHHLKEYADMKIIFDLFTAIATILGGVIVVKLGFPVLFMLMAVLALISFFGIFFKPRRLL